MKNVSIINLMIMLQIFGNSVYSQQINGTSYFQKQIPVENETIDQEINYPKDRDWIHFIFDKPSGVNHTHSTYEFNVYPNPSNGRITVTIPQNATMLVIYSLGGEELHTYDLRGKSELLPVDLSQLEPGMYFICMTIDEIQKFGRITITN